MGLSQKGEDYSTKRLIGDYWYFLKGHRVKFTIFSIIVLTAAMFTYVNSYLLGKIVDFFIKYEQGASLTGFYILVGLLAFFGSSMILMRSYGKLNLVKIGAEARKRIRIITMAKLVDLELKWHEKENTGSKVQKLQGGSDSFYKGFSFFSNEGIEILAGLVGSILIFIFISWKYALFGVIYAALYIGGEIYFNSQMRYWQLQITKASERVSGKIHESAANVLSVKALGLKESIKSSTKKEEEEYYRIWLKNKEIGHKKLRYTKVYAALGYAGFVLFIGLDAARGVIDAATVFVFANYFARLRSAMEMISNTLNNMIEIQTGVGRIMNLLDEKIREREDPSLLEVNPDWEKVEFSDVSFKYKEKWVLKNFSLTINRGDKIGLVGKSGCGKSTLSKLLLGLYIPQQGNIKIDGVELMKYKQSSINKTISIVLQDSEMFNLPLAANISISSDKPSDESLKRAVEIANIQPLIDKLPSGLKTLIGEKGYKVSGGERQRLGIARAVYSNPDLLILDEATSHLDSKTEQVIQNNLERQLKDKTLLIIAHRLSTLRNVDKIIVMDSGNIVEEGKFEDLVKKRGTFYNLYRIQKKD